MVNSVQTTKAYIMRSLFTAGIVLAISLSLSCSSDDGNGDDGGTSSPSGGGSNPVQKVFTDNRDGKSYKFVNIGSQVWMAENLNYAAGGKCYGEGNTYISGTDETVLTLSETEIQANCATYGRLYDWATAMALPASCNESSCASQISAKHRGICPSGWHIPSAADWDQLMSYVDGSTGTDSSASLYLRATSGWNWNDEDGISGNGEDTYGFSALPGGYNSSSNFLRVGDKSYWWSACEVEVEEDSDHYACSRRIDNDEEYAYYNMSYYKGRLFYVRCLKD